MSHVLSPGFSFGGLLARTLPTHLAGCFDPRPEPALGSNRYWLERALLVSMESVGISSPNPAVGCVIVKDDAELSSGATEIYKGRHAERVALSKIREPSVLEGATAFVTLEPCSHFGHQPPCSQMLVESPISRVVVSTQDPNALVNGGGMRALQTAGKKVELVSDLKAESRAWNIPFFVQHAFGRLFVALKWAQTLDGCLADDTAVSQWITGPAARAYSHWLRQKYDAVMVGANTLLLDAPSLNVRDCAPPHNRNPLPIVFDAEGAILKASTEIQEKLRNNSFSRPIVIITNEALLQATLSPWSKELQNNDKVTILPWPTNARFDELPNLLQSETITKLLGHKIQSLFVEGGPKLLSQFLKHGYGDVLHIFVSPSILGGSQFRVFPPEKSLANMKRYSLVSQARLGNDVLVECVPKDLQTRIFD